MSDIKFVNGKYTAVINGKTVKRTKIEHLQYVLRKANQKVESVEMESKFTINQRFGFLADMVTMLAKKDQASVVVTGPGGLGKSHTVTTTLAKTGLLDITGLDIGDDAPTNSYRVVKGYSTAKGLYRTLYENRNSIIVFDDCDSVLKDSTSLNILKAALDSYSRRIISYNADIRDTDLPNAFEFTGGVVFISNMNSTLLDQAIITRSLAVDLSMTSEQKIERMKHLLSQEDFMPEYDLVSKNDAMSLISKLVDSVKELSLRTLIQVTKIRKSNPNGKWKELAEYAICG
jgi:hypothetical protein|tara:strand:+ start:460 stop:1323 length:864 start_codon:yes stop_codon:yes gene_type:complete